MNHLNIVLVEPEIPDNTGNIVRTCAVTGAALHLVKPLGFSTDNRHLKRAGLDYWNKLDITYYESLSDFLTKHGQDPLYPDNSFLVFGKESVGLSEDFLKQYPNSCIRIPMRDTLRCLNLSNSVAIASYEVLRQWNFEGLSSTGSPQTFLWES
jgi:tRNA (cytidine/uridine-2'-O-)-methyltransferase